MTGALVSGQDGVAVLLTGGEYWCLYAGDSEPRAISRGLLPHLFEDPARATYHPEATLALADELLRRACCEERAFQLALICMDQVSSDTTRDLAEESLDELLEDGAAASFVEDRLFSRPLPDDASWWMGTIQGRFARVELLRESVVNAQDCIGRVR